MNPEIIFNKPEFNQIWQNTLNWQPNDTQQQLFSQLYHQIIAANRHLNLTRITEINDFWEKHLWDSLAALQYLDFAQEITQNRPLKVIDIGTGAGFPGFPIAIAFPSWNVTLLDSKQKKMTFIEDLRTYLGLNNVKTVTGRAEDIAKLPQYYRQYDLVLIRAVGKAEVCAQYSLPFLKKGGLAIIYRGHWQNDEQKPLEIALKKLGGNIEEIKQYTTPLTTGMRNCLYLRFGNREMGSGKN